MGQSGSSTGGRGGPRMSLRFSRRSKTNASSLSHTFSLPATDELPELLNINTASEEQLMTLPGITRQIAKAIVEHRQLIGRFKKVDDLALVSGIGADKLDAMRGEICVTKKSMSQASSCTQSLDSLRTNGDSPQLLNVNTASVFQLQCLPGLNQELAGNIYYHRQKKGAFKSLEDLIKVRGIDAIRLSSIKPHLSLEPNKTDEITTLLKNGHMRNGTLETKIENNNLLNNISSVPRTPGHRKSSSMPIKHAMTLTNGFAAAPVNDIFDLLSAYSHRPIIEEDFFYERDGVKCFRIATWNLDQLSLEKVCNPGVREVVCRTILENKISLLAVQDILCEAALRVLCEELNSPTLRRVREWKNNGRRWQYCMSIDQRCRKLGFLYNSNYRGITIEHLSLEQLPKEEMTASERKNFLDTVSTLQGSSDRYQAAFQLFRVCGRLVGVVNVQAVSPLETEECCRLTTACDAALASHVLLGDFHSIDNVLNLHPKCTSLISDGIHTTLSLTGSGRADILSPASQDIPGGFNGNWGIVRVGLSHLAIPHGWCWGGPASPHCPVWAEYSLPD